MSTVSSSNEKASLPAVVVIGGGFGGLCAAKALANAPVRVVLIDRSNHHLFQPLLSGSHGRFHRIVSRFAKPALAS